MVKLMETWGDLAGKLAAAGVRIEIPKFIGWGSWGLDTLGGWYPETGRLYVSEQIAHVPLLVRDVMTHEITHQIQYAISPDGSGGTGINGGPHGDLFRSCATRVAGVLGCPSPVEALICGWPHEQRPDGFFGPGVVRKETA
ncbi:hypothetical protein [Micromonospora sp. NPDC007220]|uniref:hypothetical protein n=1 Tax=Micromonospora sp. NPDC007220 TaxID=3154318 RepID=UPI0033E12DCF